MRGRQVTARQAPVRQRVLDIPNSLIREVANPNLGRDDVIPLWFGESDLTTPGFIREAAKAALDAGQTFYGQNEGDPALRQALATYLSGLYGRQVATDRITVTASGMTAIFLLMETLIDPGDNVVAQTPVWPNCREAVHVMGGETRPLNLEFAADGWRLDLDRMLDLVDDRTRAIMFNSPSNPTGWIIAEAQLAELVSFCRERGIWLIADEVYDRIAYDRHHAPSVVEFAGPEDPVISINSFSKSWCMTGWRVGWLVAPARLQPLFGKLIEFTWSCANAFAQRGAIAALGDGEPFIAMQTERCRQGRDIVAQRLLARPDVRFALPPGAFYAFFSVAGMTDSLGFTRALIEEAGVGLAPGPAFGEGGEGWLRLCFANAPEILTDAMDKLEAALDRH